MSDTSQSRYIAIDQLCIGLFVHLDLGWLDHNFPLNSFKVKSHDQLAAIKRLGLKRIRIDPTRSDCQPLPAPKADVAPPDPIQEVHYSAEELAAIAEKNDRIERISQQHEAITKCEKQFLQAASVLKDINQTIFSKPKEAHQNAAALVQQMVTSILSDKDVAIYLMNDKASGEDVYFHSLNVAVLAMMLAKEMNMPAADIEMLGIGCLFHDIGKKNIPDKVLLKTDPLTRAERNLLQLHCEYGETIAQTLRLPEPAVDVIRQHHECIDGSGYPRHLKGEQMSPLARIVAIVNAYDNLCNKINPMESLSPYAALSHMFSSQRSLFQAEPLTVFIRCLGVYPPGTVVRLSDGTVGMVISVNSGHPLRPSVLIYNKAVPKTEAIILDLQQEQDLHINESLRPAQLPREIYDYLSPRKRMTYYFDSQQQNAPKRS